MSILKINNLQLLDASRNISLSKIAEMNGGFSFRNKIVDGRFDFWYEGTTQSDSGYGSDTMWLNESVGSTKIHSRQALVAGVDLPAIDCPTAKYFSRTVVTSVAGGSNTVTKRNMIEDVKTLAGKTVTVSFYAKADSAKPIGVSMVQDFGVGGSSTVFVAGQLVSLSSGWSCYSLQFSLPSTFGKTITANSALMLMFWFDGGSIVTDIYNISGMVQQSGTFDIACVQLEEGTVATPFEELPIEVSQTRVNRYYETSYDYTTKVGSISQVGVLVSWGLSQYYVSAPSIKFKTEKRAVPSLNIYNPTTGSVNSCAEFTPSTVYNASRSAVAQLVDSTGFTWRGDSASLLQVGYVYRIQYSADARL